MFKLYSILDKVFFTFFFCKEFLRIFWFNVVRKQKCWGIDSKLIQAHFIILFYFFFTCHFSICILLYGFRINTNIASNDENVFSSFYQNTKHGHLASFVHHHYISFFSLLFAFHLQCEFQIQHIYFICVCSPYSISIHSDQTIVCIEYIIVSHAPYFIIHWSLIHCQI